MSKAAERLAAAEQELSECLERLEGDALDPVTQERARDNVEEALDDVRAVKAWLAAARAEGFARAREIAADEAALECEARGEEWLAKVIAARIRAMQDDGAGEGGR